MGEGGGRRGRKEEEEGEEEEEEEVSVTGWRINKQTEPIALDRQRTQQQKPDSPKVTLTGIPIHTR